MIVIILNIIIPLHPSVWLYNPAIPSHIRSALIPVISMLQSKLHLQILPQFNLMFQ